MDLTNNAIQAVKVCNFLHMYQILTRSVTLFPIVDKGVH